MTNLNAWAENLTKEIYLEWKNNWPSWEPGFATFFSPVTAYPELMIISLQPGGNGDIDKGDFKKAKNDFETGNFKLPPTNGYANKDTVMARAIAKLFGDGKKLLENSVAFPLIFFRAPNIGKWKKLPRKDRMKMEEFSLTKAKEIIKKLRPQRILVVGMDTYDKLKNKLDLKNEKILRTRNRKNNPRMIVNAKYAGHEIFAVIHLSGKWSRPNNAEMDKLREWFNEEFLSSKSL